MQYINFIKPTNAREVSCESEVQEIRLKIISAIIWRDNCMVADSNHNRRGLSPRVYLVLLVTILLTSFLFIGGCNKNDQSIPEKILKIINNDFYSEATWSLPARTSKPGSPIRSTRT